MRMASYVPQCLKLWKFKVVCIKYNFEITDDTFRANLNRINNQLYKVLCYKEEKREWDKLLNTIINELVGYKRLFNEESLFLAIIAKIESLFEQDSFLEFRRTVFECMSLIDEVSRNVGTR